MRCCSIDFLKPVRRYCALARANKKTCVVHVCEVFFAFVPASAAPAGQSSAGAGPVGPLDFILLNTKKREIIIQI
jgi:hypothetical protein